MKENLISVIVPVYKVEKYLKKCVDSIINQTYRNLEIILVDDGSPDSCPQMCDEYLKIDSRIKVIHQENGGLSAARNSGIRMANGEYIGFVDSDDYIVPTMYETLFNNLVEKNSDLAICNYKFVDEDGLPIHQQTESPINDEILTGYETLEKLNENGWWYYITAWNKLYKRNIFDKIEFPEGKIHEDAFIMHEIFFKCKKITTISECLYFYVQRKGSIMFFQRSKENISNSVAVKHLDDIEAFTKRCKFYKENNLSDLMTASLQSLFRSYMEYRSYVSIFNFYNRTRVREVDKMFKKTYFEFSSHISLKDRIKYAVPDVYFNYFKLKGKFHFNIRLHIIKVLLSYLIEIFFYRNVLIDTPTHGNIGDQAIVLSEQQLLKENNIKYVELTASVIDNKEESFAKLTPINKNVIVHGGGFLGCLWPNEEYRFRRILKAFSKHRVIVFPQTVTFDMSSENGLAFFEESKKCYYAHQNLTVFVRDQRSYDFMNENMPKVHVELVPDIVTIMKVPKYESKRSGILFCMRKDHEKKINKEEIDSILKIINSKCPDENIEYTDTVLQCSILPANRNTEVGNKLKQFSSVKLVITDRLHGMVFAALVGTPCIALGNINGKVKFVYKWIKELEYINYIDSINDFSDVIKTLNFDKEYKYDYDLVKEKFKLLVDTLKG